MDYSQAIDYLCSFPDWERGTTSPRGQIMTLASVKSLLARLGNPHLGRGTIHITGSKGKGSTSHMVAAILTECGLGTALFTSPHLHSYCEQIAFNCQPVSEFEFAQGIKSIMTAVDLEHESILGPVSTFGVLCALFFCLSSQRSHLVDWQIVEVGLGGLNDATNVFEEKDLAIITPISLEHTSILGKTTAEIAAIKAGIITPGCTVILAPQQDPLVKPVIVNHCAQVGAKLIDVGELYKTKRLKHTHSSQVFELSGPHTTKIISLRMLGQHQIVNATTAFAAADVLREKGVSIDYDKVVSALKNASVPGRFEILKTNPTIVVDGAHNGESALALRQTLIDHLNAQACTFIIGVNSDKDIEAILKALAPIAKRIIATKSKNPRAMDPEHIASIGGYLRLLSSKGRTIFDAIRLGLSSIEKNEILCITGSLYVVAQARKLILPWSCSRPQ